MVPTHSRDHVVKAACWVREGARVRMWPCEASGWFSNTVFTPPCPDLEVGPSFRARSAGADGLRLGFTTGTEHGMSRSHKCVSISGWFPPLTRDLDGILKLLFCYSFRSSF